MYIYITDEIKTKLRSIPIKDIIKDYVPIENNSCSCCCPFHKEKTPSFKINNKKNKFKCFGCGETGDAIDFIMKIESINFVDACLLIASRNNIDVPKQKQKRFRTKDVAFIGDHRQQINYRKIKNSQKQWEEKAHAFIGFAHNQLFSFSNKMDYLKKRWINEKIIRKYKIGYNPKTYYRKGPLWGLEEDKRIWLPDGIVIPLLDKGNCRIRIRRDFDKQKKSDDRYIVVSGSSMKSFIIKQPETRAVFLFESELDALAFSENMKITSISFGGNTIRPCKYSMDIIMKSKILIVAYDNDDGGKVGFAKIKNLLSPHYLGRIVYHPTPGYKDFGDAVQECFDLETGKGFDASEWTKKCLPKALINYPWLRQRG